VFILVGMFKNHSIVLKKEVGFKIIVCLFFMVMYLPFTGSNRYGYLIYFVVPIIGVVLFLLVNQCLEEIWCAFSSIVVVLAALSLVFFVLGTIGGIISPTGTTTFEWGYRRTCNNYFNLYYEAQRLKGAAFSARNCGLFTEAPMYSFILCIAFAYELFLNQKRRKIRIAILLITIITTISTTGYFVVIIALVFKYMEKAFKTNKMTVRKLILIVFMLIAAGVMFIIFSYRATYSAGINSNAVRVDHLSACISVFFNKPLFGCGYANLSGVLSSAQYEQGMSVGLPYLLAVGGLTLGSVLIVPYIVNARYALKKRYYSRFFFETLILILYFFTAVTGTPIMAFYMGYAIAIDRKRIQSHAEQKSLKDM